MAKSHTRADWTRRPLSEAVLDYAAEDVEYLLPAADILSEGLDKKGRLDWARQDSALLLDTRLYDISGEQAIDRLKGARNFRGAKRAAAVRMAAWREEEAIRRNRPRQWIIRDNVLLDIAYKLPSTEKQLANIEGIPAKLVGRVGKQIIEVVGASQDDDDGYRPPQPPDEEQKALLKEMQAHVADCAKGLDLAAETVASKRELSTVIISGNRDSRVFTGWRKDLIGESLLQML
jgi:ribonuclease D